MEDSILNSIKNMLSVNEDYHAFDLDILTYINSTFSVLHQLGLGPDEGFYIEDDSSTWDEFFDTPTLNLIRSYVGLKVRLLFDPPTTSFLLEAMNKQIEEFEFRISFHREHNLNPVDPMTEVVLLDE